MKIFFLVLLVFVGGFGVASAVNAQSTSSSVIRPIFYPTEKIIPLSNDFGQARSGHAHEGNDLIGPKMTPLYAAADGRVDSIEIPQATWGYAVTLQDADGYTYHYLHVNNDSPGTDDGAGGPEHAYAPGILPGAHVTKGQLIGWMGDSGNAETITSHLHFEIRQPGGQAIDPYPSLLAAMNEGKYSPTIVRASVPDINTDKGLIASGEGSACISGSLVKSPVASAVYYCGANGKRYAFPNQRVYFSWYNDFKNVQTLTNEALATIPLGGNVTYRPGVKMVKLESIPNVYVIEKGGVLRWVKTSQRAASLYGSTWNKQVDDLSDAYFTNYTMGEPIE